MINMSIICQIVVIEYSLLKYILVALQLFAHHSFYACLQLRTAVYWETFHGNFIIASQSFNQKSAERKWTKKYFFFHIFWGLNSDLTSNKPTHCLLDYGVFYLCYVCVYLIHEWRQLQFKDNYERQIFERLLMAILQFTCRVFARRLRERSHRRIR